VSQYFIPVVVESPGALGQDATEFLQELGGRIAAATGDPLSSFRVFFRAMHFSAKRGLAIACRPSV